MAIFDITYVGDMPYLKLEGGTVTGATIFNSSVTANSGSITNNLAVGSINGVTVGSSPKFTDTTYSVATTSANGLLPALGGGTTNYLRADGSWAKPPGTTYSVATTGANGLMAAADKVAVDKIGSGTLNTTNQTIIPAINELVTGGINSSGTEWVRFGNGIQICWGSKDMSFNGNSYSKASGTITFPTSFSAVPMITASASAYYDYASTNNSYVEVVGFESVTKTEARYIAGGLRFASGGASITTGTLRYIAIGTWA